MSKLIALAYSGGLDTSAIIPWLRENMDCEVVAVVGDVGQGGDELAGIETKARNSGARECHVVDLKREFMQDFIEPMLLTGAIYEGRYLLGTAIARPLLAKAQVQVARKVGATALCHGCTGKGNDQVRFEAAFAALAPDLEVIAPWRVWKLKGRQDLLDYLKKHNVPTTATATKLYSRDRNLWHISHEGGAIEDPWNAPPDDVWMLTADIKDAPDKHEDVTITFEHGRARKLNGTQTSPEVLVQKLNEIGGRHGVGRIDLVENRRVGMKSRGLYETPGGTVLVEALRGLEEMVLDRETRHWKEHLGLTFAELVYDGRWFTPLREALSVCAEKMAEKLTGDIVVRLHKGHATTIQRRSANALYSHTFASFDMNELYDQKHAEGFIRLLSLPERIAALKSGGLK